MGNRLGQREREREGERERERGRVPEGWWSCFSEMVGESYKTN
jgi:hypothetical protein